MKRILCALICLLLILSMASCAPKKDDGQLLVGFGRASITPDFSMPLQGFDGWTNRWFNNVQDPIYASALAFTDSNNNTVIIITYDLADCNNTGIGFATKNISKTYDIPRSNIIVTATHTHSAPTHSTSLDEYIVTSWSDVLRDGTIEAVKQAMENRLPAEVYTSSIETENLNFVRHYYMDDGSITGNNFGDATGKTYSRHAQKADTELQMLRFKREGGKDIVLANFQCHPLLAGGGKNLNLTSDYIGPMTRYMEENMDCHFAYFSGAGGNLNPHSEISRENITLDHNAHGEALGRYAMLACSDMKKLEGNAVQFMEKTVTLKAAPGAGAASYDLDLYAFSVGGACFINAPYEMFSSNGEYIKDNSPFGATFVTTLGFSSHCYVPDAATFAYDVVSYEETKCSYAEGSGETLAETFVDMLKQIHDNQAK